jgi:hypothetical protein
MIRGAIDMERLCFAADGYVLIVINVLTSDTTLGYWLCALGSEPWFDCIFRNGYMRSDGEWLVGAWDDDIARFFLNWTGMTGWMDRSLIWGLSGLTMAMTMATTTTTTTATTTTDTATTIPFFPGHPLYQQTPKQIRNRIVLVPIDGCD